MTGDFKRDGKTSYIFPVRTKDGYSYLEQVDPLWVELKDIIEEKKLSLLLTFLPPELQLEKLILLTAAQCDTQTTSGTVFDLSWNLAALSAVSHDAIVTTATVFPYLEKELAKNPELCARIACVIFVGETPESTEAHSYEIVPLSHPFDAYVG